MKHERIRSKEEFLDMNDVHSNDFYDVVPVLKAMDEYAKQESAQRNKEDAIAFAEFIANNKYSKSIIKKTECLWVGATDTHYYTTEQLYELYKTKQHGS